MSDDIGVVFAVRALNHLRREFLPGYLGLRLLVDRLDPNLRKNWLAEYVGNRALTGRSQVYWSYKSYKGSSQGGIEYRNCYIPSPTSALTEAKLLHDISDVHSFATSKSVYSYRWPKSKDSGYSFEYFFDGYKERDRGISARVEADKDSCVVVTDISRFYPNANKDIIKKRFQDRIHRASWSLRSQEAACINVEQLLGATERGIPIGPALGHVLGHVALEKVDRSLSEKYGNRYFRYVDDIAIVDDKSRSQDVVADIKALLEEEGLSLNADKTDIVNSGKWRPVSESEGTELSFASLVQRLYGFMIMNPGKYEGMRAAFLDNGFTLPLSHYRSTIGGTRFKRFLKLRIRQIGFRQAFNIYFGYGQKEIISYALHLRAAYWERLRRLRSSKIPDESMLRRWAIQDLRYVINRLIYLGPFDNTAELLEWVPTIPEFDQTRAVLAAIVGENVTELLAYPGPAVASFCQLWSEREVRSVDVNWPERLEGASMDSAAILAAYNVARPPPREFSGPKLSESHAFMAFCAGIPPKEREHAGFSYIDELRSLQLGVDAQEWSRLLNRRFDDREDVLLDGLLLGVVGSS